MKLALWGSTGGLIVKNPAGIYLFRINSGNTRTTYKICSKLTIKTLERRHLRRSGVSLSLIFQTDFTNSDILLFVDFE